MWHRKQIKIIHTNTHIHNCECPQKQEAIKATHDKKIRQKKVYEREEKKRQSAVNTGHISRGTRETVNKNGERGQRFFF